MKMLYFAGLPEFQARPPINLTLDTVSTTSAILKWFCPNRSLDVAMSSRLSVHRLSRGHARHRQMETFALVDDGVAVAAGDIVGWYHLGDLEPDTAYSAQLVAGHIDVVDGSLKNISNLVYFNTFAEGITSFFILIFGRISWDECTRRKHRIRHHHSYSV
jgi:hypothetical protein